MIKAEAKGLYPITNPIHHQVSSFTLPGTTWDASGDHSLFHQHPLTILWQVKKNDTTSYSLIIQFAFRKFFP